MDYSQLYRHARTRIYDPEERQKVPRPGERTAESLLPLCPPEAAEEGGGVGGEAMAEVREHLEQLYEGYGGGPEIPLKGYAAIMGAFVGAAGIAALGVAARQRSVKRAIEKEERSLLKHLHEHEIRVSELAERLTPGGVQMSDVVLLGLATHKLTRIITKDWVTAPLRAPFTKFEESKSGGEMKERSRGEGMQRALGDLLTCQFCTGPWVAGLLSAGLVFVPRLTRRVAAGLVMAAISNWLHEGYERVRGR